MEVEAGGGGQQLALKDVLVHGDPYDYAYEEVRHECHQMNHQMLHENQKYLTNPKYHNIYIQLRSHVVR